MARADYDDEEIGPFDEPEEDEEPEEEPEEKPKPKRKAKARSADRPAPPQTTTTPDGTEMTLVPKRSVSVTVKKNVNYTGCEVSLHEGWDGMTVADQLSIARTMLSDGIHLVAQALGVDVVETDDGRVMFAAEKAKTESKGGGERRSGGGGRSSGGRSSGGSRGGGGRSSGRGNSGGSGKPNYDEEDEKALWKLWNKDKGKRHFYDNLDHDQWPNVKPKPSAFEVLDIDEPETIKPLYAKHAPDWAEID